MRFEEFVTKEVLVDAATALKVTPADLVIHRIDSLRMPSIENFKVVAKIGTNGFPFVSAVRLHSKDLYKLNYGMVLCELRDDKKTRFCLFSSYSSQYGEIVFLVTDKVKHSKKSWYSPAYRCLRTFNRSFKKNMDKVGAPILEQGLLEEIVRNTVTFVRNCHKRKLSINRGVILHGEPGNGKSFLTGYIKELAQFYNLQCREFKQCKAADAINGLTDINIFDDFDISLLGKNRQGGAVASDILSAMSGTNKADTAKAFIFTTNEPINSLDNALLRSGRIDIIREVKKPTVELRKRLILEKWPAEILLQIEREQSLDMLLEMTNNFNFADVDEIKHILLVNEFDGKPITIKEAVEQYFTNKNMKIPTIKQKLGF